MQILLFGPVVGLLGVGAPGERELLSNLVGPEHPDHTRRVPWAYPWRDRTDSL